MRKRERATLTPEVQDKGIRSDPEGTSRAPVPDDGPDPDT